MHIVYDPANATDGVGDLSAGASITLLSVAIGFLIFVVVTACGLFVCVSCSEPYEELSSQVRRGRSVIYRPRRRRAKYHQHVVRQPSDSSSDEEHGHVMPRIEIEVAIARTGPNKFVFTFDPRTHDASV